LRSSAVGSAVFVFFFLFFSNAIAGPAKKGGEAAYVFPSILTNGEKAGDLILGRTTVEEAVRMHPQPPLGPYDGDVRPVEAFPALSADGLPELKTVYNPWQTMYSLFFDSEKKLVMVSELHELGSLSEKKLLADNPGLTETYRDNGLVEYRLDIQPCVTLIALVTGDGWVEELSVAYSCDGP